MLNPAHLIETGGLLLIGIMVFAESGIMVGVLLPGDTLLLSAGILAAGHKLSLVNACVAIALAAIAGDNVGFQIGRSLGHKLFRKEDGIVFRKEYLVKTNEFYHKYGKRATLVEHFVPVIRSFMPLTAGASNMNRWAFVACNAVGDIAWALSFTLFGYFVGSRIPRVDRYIDPVIVLVVAVFATPALYRIFSHPKVRTSIRSKFTRSKTVEGAANKERER